MTVLIHFNRQFCRNVQYSICTAAFDGALFAETNKAILARQIDKKTILKTNKGIIFVQC